MATFIRLTSVVLSLLAVLATASTVRAEDAVQGSYDACRYAKHLIRTPETFYIGGIVGTSWLEASLCEETNEACEGIGRLCGGDVPGYQNLKNLCGGGEELKVCVPRTSRNDPNGVCVAITDGCASAAGSCREASCDLGPWTPIYPPEPIIPGNDHDLQVQFALPSYDRPVACVFTPKPNAGPQCSFQGNPEPRPCDPSTEICDLTTPPPPPTEHPCDGIVDPGLKACCEEQGGLDLDAVEACVPDSDDPSDACNIIINGNIENSGQMNICCQYVNNSGVIEDSEIVQECENVYTPGDDVPVPGIPEGSESAGGAPLCTVTALDTAEKVNGKFIAVTKEGTGISLKIDHQAPLNFGGTSLELTQTEGPAVTISGPMSVPFAASASWTVQMGRPESMVGEYIPNAAFLVTVYGADGQILHQTSCEEKAGLHAQGGQGGCSLIR